MDRELLKIIDEGIKEHKNLQQIRQELINSGFTTETIDKALERQADRLPEIITQTKKQQSNIFLWKETLDRVGYGFAANQYINILFLQTINAAGLGSIAYIIIGIVMALKSLISSITSSFIKELSNIKTIPKKTISRAGIIFGFSFLLMAFAKTAHSVIIFIIALFLGIIGVVTYGDAYQKLIRKTLKKEKMSFILSRISQYGIIITSISLLISGYLMDYIPSTGKKFTLELPGKTITFKAYGYLLSFEITALAFIIAGYLLSKIKENKKEENNIPTKEIIKTFWNKRIIAGKEFFSNKIILLLTTANTLLMISQLLINTYIGIFIFENFKETGLGPFLNVAIVFFFAILLSVFGPQIARSIHKKTGFSPMLVFGTLLTAMTPFFIFWKPNLQVLIVTNTLTVLGLSITGSAQGHLIRKLLKEKERETFFSFTPFFMIIPTIILVPIASYIAQTNGLITLFKIIFYALLIVMTLYIILVGLSEKKGFEN